MAQNGKYDKYFQFCSNLKGYNFDHFDSIEPFELFHLNFPHGFCLFRILKKAIFDSNISIFAIEYSENGRKLSKIA